MGTKDEMAKEVCAAMGIEVPSMDVIAIEATSGEESVATATPSSPTTKEIANNYQQFMKSLEQEESDSDKDEE
jgi:hypothetical protein